MIVIIHLKAIQIQLGRCGVVVTGGCCVRCMRHRIGKTLVHPLEQVGLPGMNELMTLPGGVSPLHRPVFPGPAPGLAQLLHDTAHVRALAWGPKGPQRMVRKTTGWAPAHLRTDAGRQGSTIRAHLTRTSFTHG